MGLALNQPGMVGDAGAGRSTALPGSRFAHYDIETLCQPELSESLRHGVTTVMLGSRSLSTVYLDSVDAGDIFGRVEAIPRHYVIEQLDGARSWLH